MPGVCISIRERRQRQLRYALLGLLCAACPVDAAGEAAGRGHVRCNRPVSVCAQPLADRGGDAPGHSGRARSCAAAPSGLIWGAAA